MIIINADWRKSSNQENHVNQGSDRKVSEQWIIKDYGITMIIINADWRKSSNQENHVNQGSDRKNVWTLIIKDYRITMILYIRIGENQVIKEIMCIKVQTRKCLNLDYKRL